MPERSLPPESLHLLRLAAATPDTPVSLPDSAGRLRALHLTSAVDDGEAERWYLCLSGELILDLPSHEFVHLRAGEVVRVPAGVARRLTPVRAAGVLVIGLEGMPGTVFPPSSSAGRFVPQPPHPPEGGEGE